MILFDMLILLHVSCPINEMSEKIFNYMFYHMVYFSEFFLKLEFFVRSTSKQRSKSSTLKTVNIVKSREGHRYTS